MIAVVPVRNGEPAFGGEAAIAEAKGRAVLVGSGAIGAAQRLDIAGGAEEVAALDIGEFQPGRWAELLAPQVEGRGTIVLPASADGRDLAPRLACALGRPLLAGALHVRESEAWLVHLQGRQVAHYRASTPFVATLQPFALSPSAGSGGDRSVRELSFDPAEQGGSHEATTLGLLEADPATMDLREAERILAAGAGVGTAVGIAKMQKLAESLGACLGATRVVTDAGLLGHERQIGTTGVAVTPRCYIAIGVSGAAQHLGGVGTPEHVLAVNLDPSCPMMAIADVAIVTDAEQMLDYLLDRLGTTGDA